MQHVDTVLFSHLYIVLNSIGDADLVRNFDKGVTGRSP